MGLLDPQNVPGLAGWIQAGADRRADMQTGWNILEGMSREKRAEEMHPLQMQTAQANLEKLKRGEYKQYDLGDKIEIRDESGRLIQTLPKGVSPSTQAQVDSAAATQKAIAEREAEDRKLRRRDLDIKAAEFFQNYGVYPPGYSGGAPAPVPPPGGATNPPIGPGFAPMPKAGPVNLPPVVQAQPRIGPQVGPPPQAEPVPNATGQAPVDPLAGIDTTGMPPKDVRALRLDAAKKQAQNQIEVNKKNAAEAAKLDETLKKNEASLDFTDNAMKEFLKFSDNAIGGTGAMNYWNSAFQALFGIRPLPGGKDEEVLVSAFNQVNMRNMVATFQGMARSIDSDAERRAWNTTQPSINFDDPANASILVWQMTWAAKARAEIEAKKKFLASGRPMAEYQSPVFGKQRAYFDKDGDIHMIRIGTEDESKQKGLMDPETYATYVLTDEAKKRRRNIKRAGG